MIVGKREEDLENVKEIIVEFKERVNAKVKKQEKLDIAEERNSRKGGVTRKVYSKDIIQVK